MDSFPLPWTSPDSNAQSALTLQELKLQAISYSIRSKPSWWTKYKDKTIRKQWKAEALATPVAGDPILKDEQSCYTRIYESDTLIPPELRDRLKEAVKALENVPGAQKDWRPRSDGQVLDLVHPSLYPIVYGRTLRYPEGVKPEERKIEDFQPIAALDSKITPGEDWSFSRKFAWLPTDFKITEDGSSAKAVSYINNLHPSNTELYSIIEALVARFSFLFDRVLTDLICYDESLNLRINEKYYFHDDEEEKPEQEESESEEDYEARVDTWNMQRDINLPTVPEDGYTEDISQRSETFTVRGKEVQIIVKLVNIHLTPEKPVYPGGSWHVEGMANERIVSSGVYYYDSENITESELEFRRAVSCEDLYIEEEDELGLMRVWGLREFVLLILPVRLQLRSDKNHRSGYSGGPANQRVGATPTPAGRCLAFPNIYQHKVSPFELADKTKPGHRKMIALLLLDYEHPRFSTTDIPPQQAEWYEVAMQQAPKTSLLRKLPAEIMKETTRHLPNLMTLDEAKKYRLEMTDERTAFIETQDEKCFALEFSPS
ncbi:hypothetical protein M407DRAFT_20541 [Tulasnella calospora MUT 4182]|uniref:Uncharacterized protein n=1 Tax=Tulasnella calospora MUT 4182 TaxID=1051891 RepID=A0A0C3L9E3_9AGAM|nr:hypothetical protein M407DRAFT_20541 [Tulasnella calospora MUT 4182]